MGDVSLVAVAGCRQLGDEFLVAVAYMRDNRGEPGYACLHLLTVPFSEFEVDIKIRRGWGIQL